MKINGVTHYLWRDVDHEGEVLESIVIKTRDRKAALKFLKKLDLPGECGEHHLRNQEVFYGKRERTDAGVSA